MLNHELIAKLQEHPANLPILMKVSQELQGMEDDFSWLRGEAYSVYQEELYLDLRQGEGGAYCNRDQLDDEIDCDPDGYLGDGAEDWPEEYYEQEKEKFLDKLPLEKVLVIDVKP